jgi:hypothetical protein
MRLIQVVNLGEFSELHAECKARISGEEARAGRI